MTCVCPTVRTGFLHLAEALAYRRDTEVPVRAIIALLKAGERCNAEAELIGKGITFILLVVWLVWECAAIWYNISHLFGNSISTFGLVPRGAMQFGQTCL